MDSDRSDYDIIIIGAGIGGLTAGNILAENGRRVLILEKNYAPGGAVSTFYRNGYPIDISHSLCAVREGAILRQYFEYLGIYDKLEFIELEKAFIYIRNPQESPVFCYTDLDRYTQELSRFFPQEKNNIKALFKEVIEIWEKEVLRSYYNPSLLQLLSYPFLFPRLFKYRNYTFEQFLSRFTKNSELKEIISVVWAYLGLKKEQASALYMICLIGSYHQNKSYFVKGGFGEIVKALASNFERLGGKMLLNTEASEILLKDKNKAYGVRDKKGNNYYAEKIISNADSKKTFLELISNKNILPKKFLNKIETAKMSCTAIQVHLAVEAEIDKQYLSVGSIVLPINIDLGKGELSQSLVISIIPLSDLIPTEKMNNYIFNIVWMPVSYNLWKDLFISEKYEDSKDSIAHVVIEKIKEIWPIKQINFIHVLTPLSLEGWLNVTEGAMYDLAATPNQMLINRLKHESPIEKLYLVGAKTFPGGGIPGALISAFTLCDILLKNRLTHKKLLIKS